jgi:hypothetical protein
MSNPSTRRVAQKIRGQSFPSLTERSLAGFLLALQRGIKDVGFVGAGLRAERQRRQGI